MCARTGRLMAGAAVLLIGCGDAQGPEQPRAGSIRIHAPSQVMEIDATMQLSATVLNTTGAVMSGPVVQWHSSNTSVADVSLQGVVRARSGGVTTIRATSGSVSDNLEITVRPPACTVATAGGSIAIGGQAEGRLDATACLLPHGAYGNGWRLVLAAPTVLAITMTSTTLDALVVVTDMNFDIVGFDDDSGGGTNARLLLQFAPGEYVIWATTFPEQQGEYRLAVEPARTGSCTEPRGALTAGQSVNGTLTESESCLLPSGHFADGWQYSTASQITVTADLTSMSHDTYLLLADSTGAIIAADDDGGGNLNSRITHTFGPGTYMFWATTYAPGVLGPYQLRLSPTTGSQTAGAASRAAKHVRSWGGLPQKE